MAGGTCGYAGDNGPATKASLFYQSGIALDSQDNLYIADNLSNRVRKVTTSGIISTIAGSTTNGSNYGSSGDGGLATAALLFGPLDLVIDSAGEVYIADNQNLKVRKIDTAGIIRTYAGVFGPVSTPLGDGGPATSAYLSNPLGLLLDSAGDLYISETAGQVRKVAAPAPATPAIASGGVVTASSFGQIHVRRARLMDRDLWLECRRGHTIVEQCGFHWNQRAHVARWDLRYDWRPGRLRRFHQSGPSERAGSIQRCDGNSAGGGDDGGRREQIHRCHRKSSGAWPAGTR
jgi:hypothetical protein